MCFFCYYFYERNKKMEKNHLDIDSAQYTKDGITGGEEKVIYNPGTADPTVARPKQSKTIEPEKKLVYYPPTENRP